MNKAITSHPRTLVRASRRFFPMLAALTVLAGSAAHAQQTTTPTAPAAGGGAAGAGRERMKEKLAALTPEERARFMTARRTALQDPTVQAAKAQRQTDPRAFHQAMRAAMLKADPSLGPVMDKLRANRPGKLGKGGGVGAAGASQANPRLANLTPEERGKLQAAHQAAQRDPAVATARQQLQNATTPEDRRSARLGMQEAVRSAMLRSDPSVGQILDKVGPAGGRRGGAGRFGA